MARITVSTDQLAGLGGLIRGFVRFVRRLAFVAIGATVVLVLLLQRDGFTADEAVLTILFLTPPAILLFLAQGVQALLSFPDRLRQMPAEGEERIAELTQFAGQTGTRRARGLPLLLWRLRGTVGLGPRHRGSRRTAALVHARVSGRRCVRRTLLHPAAGDRADHLARRRRRRLKRSPHWATPLARSGTQRRHPPRVTLLHLTLAHAA